MEFIGYTEKILSLVLTTNETKKFWSVGLQMIGIAFIILVCIIIVNILSSYLSSRIARDLRRRIFTKVNSFSSFEINKFSTASLITRSTNDVTQVQRTLMMCTRMMFTAPCMAFFAIRKITLNSLELTWVSIAFLGATLIVIISLLFLVMPKFSLLQKRTDKLNLVSRENLTGIRVVRAYNGEKYQKEKFEKANEDLTKTTLFLNRAMSILNPFVNTIMSTMTLALYWVGAGLINKHILNYETLATFSQYSMHVIMSFMFITLMFVMIPRGLVSLKRINEILHTEVSIEDGEVEKSENLGTIEFRNVTFKYPDAEEPVLEDISFTVEKGETVAFIGSTGSGKSTLINLIPRFYDVTSGQVLVDGIDVKGYKLATLHDKIGYVPQKANLFSGNITTNMQLANKDITEEEISKILEVAECSFIEKLEDGYTQPVSAGGKNFSGGQKQRLSIARAIAKNPEIYIFDDSFSALDFKTDKTLRSNLKKYTKTATTLIVAQRINTIKNADKIIVLDNGKMVGIGTHDELLKNNKVYREIADSQNKGDN
jgi:ATP-binding cassette subfamily B protein